MLDKIVLVVAAAAAIGYIVYRLRNSSCCSTSGGSSCPQLCNACPYSAECIKAETMDKVNAGDRFSILQVKDEDIRCQLMRLGMDVNECLTCDYVLPGGPVIVKRGRQQVAIGRNLAGQIKVEVLSRHGS
ncbi:MAG: FeoA family protein [Bacillota bacterium]|jgi:ferrous iron transport protein A|nr:FeoA family protein [Bacillota bacterium]HQD17874.1 FeoA family protein [Bacillota bacterium]